MNENTPKTNVEKLKELQDIAIAIYSCFHASERDEMYTPVIAAWDVGQRLWRERSQKPRVISDEEMVEE